MAKKYIILLFSSIFLFLFLFSFSYAESLSTLQSMGWKIILRQTVSDSFEGCDYDLPVPIDGGYIFVCHEYNYHYAYRPDFLVLQKGSQRKYLIDNEVFDGELFTGYPTNTYVDGAFDGCDYDKLIPLENGLVFQCRTYSYHYSYHPKVIIIGPTVIIDGKKYEGTLYRR